MLCLELNGQNLLPPQYVDGNRWSLVSGEKRLQGRFFRLLKDPQRLPEKLQALAVGIKYNEYVTYISLRFNEISPAGWQVSWSQQEGSLRPDGFWDVWSILSPYSPTNPYCERVKDVGHFFDFICVNWCKLPINLVKPKKKLLTM